MKLSWWTSNAWNNTTARVVVVYNAVEYILIVIRVNVVVLIIKMSRLTVGKMIVRMSSRKAQRREKSWKNVKDDEHWRIKQQVKQNACPN